MIATATSDRLLDIIADRWGGLRCAEKLLARASGSTPNAARNWLLRRNRPQIEQVLVMHARDAEFRRRFRELLIATTEDDS